jgi:type IV pilus assembly protein PilQ
MLVLTSCASRDSKSGVANPSSTEGEPSVEQPVSTSSNATDTASDTVPMKDLPKVKYDAGHDEAIKEVMELAERGYLEQAELKARGLVEQFPDDSSLKRLYNWISDKRKIARDRALEDKIREIDSRDSPFNPTVKSLLTGQKDRGLTPRPSLRDAVEEIEKRPYVPATYGKTIIHEGLIPSPTVEEGKMAALLKKEISAQLGEMTLDQILLTIGDQEGINFITDTSVPALQKKLNVNVKKMRLAQFLEYLERNLQVTFQIQDDLIGVVDGTDGKNKLEETRTYRLREGFIMPARFADDTPTRTVIVAKDQTTTTTTTERLNMFVRDGAPDKPSLLLAIDRFFKGSDYYADFERNLIVATGTPAQLDVLEQLIKEFDRPIQQVLIEARFITVTEPAFMRLGVAWETGRNLLNQQAVQSEDFTKLAQVPVALPISETFTNILGRANLSATLTALEQSGESQTLSAPRVTLINNLPATISDGKIQYYYEEYTVAQTVFERGTTSSLVPKGTPTKLTSGVQLDVVASISGDGESILMGLHPKVSSDVQLVTFATVTDVNALGEPVSTFDIKLPESRTQELSTRVSVRSGETVVMGGVMERNQTTYVESVPLLGNIPIIGALFRRRTEIDTPRYLLIFVTATIVSETGEFVLPASTKPNAPVPTAD